MPRGRTKRAAKSLPPDRGFLPLAVRLRVHRLYVTDGADVPAIAADVNRDESAIHALIKREGWDQAREQMAQTAAGLLIAYDRDKAAKQMVDAVTTEIGEKAGEVALGALDLAREKMEEKDALGLKLAAGAAKDLVGIYRQAKGLDATGNGSVGGGVPLAILVGNFERVKPAAEVARAEPINVTVEPVPVEASF